jgi:hypothetical protein
VGNDADIADIGKGGSAGHSEFRKSCLKGGLKGRVKSRVFCHDSR